MSTQTTRIARIVMKKSNKGSMIFNDRLADGRRSLKVWGWDLPQYERCQELLKKEGFTSEIVGHTYAATRWRPARTQYRLHVNEVI